MSFAVVFALCFLQTQNSASSPDRVERVIETWQVTHSAESAAADQAAKREAAYEEQQFVNKFNNLLNNLRDFVNQYNHHVIDLKKVKAVKKAWSDLEKTDGWLRMDEASGH